MLHLAPMRTYMKRVRNALEGGDLAVATETLPKAVKAISKAATKGVIHSNTASRYISRLTVAVNKAQAA